MPKPHKYRDVIKKLRKYDKGFKINSKRGKGSERVLSHEDINGSAECFPISCHGEGTEIGKGMLSAIIRRFNLPKNFFD